ncbi:MAG: glycosyltransferase family 4 protein, partial [Atribacterota bacterium]
MHFKNQNNKKLFKILIVHSYFYPEKVGGSEKVTYDISNILAKAGHEVTVLVGSNNKDIPTVKKKENLKIIRYYRSEANPIFTIFSVIFNLYRIASNLMKNDEFDIINIHSSLCGWGLLLNRDINEVPLIYTFHSPAHIDFKYENKYRRYRGFKKFLKSIYLELYPYLIKKQQLNLLKKSYKVICLSNYMKKQVLNIFGISDKKTVVIPHCVDINKLNFKRRHIKNSTTRRLKDEKKIILTVRRLEYRMGVDNLIRAM